MCMNTSAWPSALCTLMQPTMAMQAALEAL
jgi:hypothetical protein